MRVTFYGGFANSFNLAGKDAQEDKAYGQEVVVALDTIVAKPLVDVKIELIMSDKQFDDLNNWATCNADLAKTIATAMKALHALNHIDLEDTSFLTFLSWRQTPFDLADFLDVAEAWRNLQSAVDVVAQAMSIHKCSALHPRSLVPIAEALGQAQTALAWEDVLTSMASVAFANSPNTCSAEVLESLRSVGDGLLQVWRLLKVDDNDDNMWRMWRFECQKSGWHLGLNTK